jgi:uncharacterized protein YcfL
VQNTVLIGLMIGSIALAGCASPQSFAKKYEVQYRDMATISLCNIVRDATKVMENHTAGAVIAASRILKKRGEDCK